MTDHFLSATLLALTLFAAHVAVVQAVRSRLRYSIDGGPILTTLERRLDLTGLAKGRHTITLEVP